MDLDASPALPPRWASTTLGQVLTVLRGVTYNKQQITNVLSEGFVPVLRATNIGYALDFNETVYVPARCVSQEQYLQSGDIVVAASSGSASVVGKAAPLLHDWHGSFGAFCYGLRPATDIAPKYLSFFLQTSEYRNQVSALAAGVNINNLRQNHIEDMQVRLAPLPEQHRIVAEIERQFSLLDAGVANLKRVQANLKRYRASVLQAACTGQLVPTEAELAQAEGRAYEQADVLLMHILAERRARWEAEQLAKMEAQGKLPINGAWKAKYQEPAAPDANGLQTLPEGWIWTTLGQAFGVFVGATPSRGISAYWGGNIRWVSSGEVAFCRINETRERITEAGLAHTSTKVHPAGTVLIGMIGEGKTRGQVAILGQPAANNQNCAAIRASETAVPPEYVYRYLEGRYAETRQAGSGNNQPALNKTSVSAMPVPLPPLTELERIVAEVERRLSVVDNLEQVVKANLRRAERLRQAILKEAFAGRLVPQEPADEPAGVLLERIRTAREVVQKEKKKPTAHPTTLARNVVQYKGKSISDAVAFEEDGQGALAL